MSPAIANLCALHLDLASMRWRRMVGGDCTRYADDVAFSGGEELRRGIDRFGSLVVAVAYEEGFRVNHRKTRAMHRGDRQVLTGIVVNARANVPRPHNDRLKAVLHNCARFGAASQNREAIAISARTSRAASAT
jgi:RNA-directed DNA polymerase